MKRIFTPFEKKHTVAFILATICIWAGQTSSAQVCSNQNNIFGLNSSGVIYPIDITNANVGAKINTAAYSGTSPNQSNAIGFNSVNGFFYYFKVNPTSSSGGEFISFDPVLQVYTTLATSPIRATVHAGCVSFNGTGYYCTDVNGSLYYYNITLDTWTTITSNILDQYGTSVNTVIQGQNSGDMAIDGLGNLWLVTSSSTNYALYKIPTPLPTTVQASLTANMIIAPTTVVPSGSSGFQGIAFNAVGTLFLSSASSDLFKITNTTTITWIGTLTKSGVGNDLTSCSFPFGILPITWSSFTVSMNNNQVSINWGIEPSSDTKGFYIERSNDDKSWSVLSYVDYNIGNTKYSSVDANPVEGNNYYRIKEVDYSGSDNYSDIKLISISKNGMLSVWPNPVKDIVHIQSNNASDVMAQIYDLLGKIVVNTNIHQGDNPVNIGALASGTYIIHFEEKNGTVVTKKIIKRQ